MLNQDTAKAIKAQEAFADWPALHSCARLGRTCDCLSHQRMVLESHKRDACGSDGEDACGSDGMDACGSDGGRRTCACLSHQRKGWCWKATSGTLAAAMGRDACCSDGDGP